MRKFFGTSFLIALLLVFSVSAFGQNNGKNIVGKWEGTLSVSGRSLRLVFNVDKNTDGKYISTMDSPDQVATGIKVDNTDVKGNKVVFEINSISGYYEGTLSGDGETITGTWEQRNYSFPLILKREGQAMSANVQKKPKEEVPYEVEDVYFHNKKAGIKLAGTLTKPKGGGPFPTVVLITGSGPQDRDETVFGHKPFLVIADYLTRRGIAVLRYDDRGVGKSTGDFSKATTRDFAEDVISAVNYLRSRKDIYPRKIGLIGHSEGGLIAPMVAVKDSNIAFIILMAGPGLPGDEILEMQSRLIAEVNGVSGKELEKDLAINKKIYNILKSDDDSAKVCKEIKMILNSYIEGLGDKEKREIGSKDKFINKQITQIMTPWFRFFVKYDPRPTLEKVKCPVLAIGGSKDLQVPAKENLAAIKKALKEGGNKDFTVMEIPGLNHLFQEAKTGAPSEYAKIKETISPKALKIMGDWISKRVK